MISDDMPYEWHLELGVGNSDDKRLHPRADKVFESATGHKPTSTMATAMSAFGWKADVPVSV